MDYLETERECVSRMAESQTKYNRDYYSNKPISRDRSQTHTAIDTFHKKYYKCAYHQNDRIVHDTANCKDFQKLEQSAKCDKLRQVGACFICFGDHQMPTCPKVKPCPVCYRSNHHQLISKQQRGNTFTGTQSSNSLRSTADNNIASSSNLAL
ncbi:hypothetical protein SNE40_002756 [Patella caerulea]|uniref:Uncharacterized protein n=1 Tax=Patella caerulea TaxID=87958 RepID=A0AAN8K8E3_PATCE